MFKILCQREMAGEHGRNSPRSVSTPAATYRRTGADVLGAGGGGLSKCRRSICISLSPGCASSSGGKGRDGGAALRR